jgi:hypothetical protein
MARAKRAVARAVTSASQGFLSVVQSRCFQGQKSSSKFICPYSTQLRRLEFGLMRREESCGLQGGERVRDLPRALHSHCQKSEQPEAST